MSNPIHASCTFEWRTCGLRVYIIVRCFPCPFTHYIFCNPTLQLRILKLVEYSVSVVIKCRAAIKVGTTACVHKVDLCFKSNNGISNKVAISLHVIAACYNVRPVDCGNSSNCCWIFVCTPGVVPRGVKVKTFLISENGQSVFACLVIGPVIEALVPRIVILSLEMAIIVLCVTISKRQVRFTITFQIGCSCFTVFIGFISKFPAINVFAILLVIEVVLFAKNTCIIVSSEQICKCSTCFAFFKGLFRKPEALDKCFRSCSRAVLNLEVSQVVISTCGPGIIELLQIAWIRGIVVSSTRFASSVHFGVGARLVPPAVKIFLCLVVVKVVNIRSRCS